MRPLAIALACVLSSSVLAAQTQAPAQPAKFVRPVKGSATIEIIQPSSKIVGKEIVTKLRIKNTSAGAINLLKVDEYWYNKDSKQVSGGQYTHKKAPIHPGEIVEIELRSPTAPNLYKPQYMFRHANGDVKATAVKAFK